MPSDGAAQCLSSSGDTVRIAVRAVPGAARTGIAGILGAELKVRIAAAPEKGKANGELESFFSKILSLPKRNARVTKGLSSRSKTVEVSGSSLETVLKVISSHIT